MAFLGEIRPFAGTLPRGWLPCDGQLVEIRNHQALYSLLGTMYGGDAKNTFGLPDLRGRLTAGADRAKQQPVGATSGRSGESEPLIPFAVIRWGIAVEGRFPAP